MQTHEQLDRDHDVPVSSERSFGFVFTAACGFVGGWRLWHGHPDGGLWLGASIAFLLLALFWTAPLKPLNRGWAAVGRLLHAVVNPVMMGLIFVLSVVPIGLLMRALGRDPLRLRLDPACATYWIDCPAEERTDAMKDQF